MKPISIKMMANALGSYYHSEVLIKGMHIDSRKISQGDLFFALPGERVDGHDFLQQAQANGAVAAVVSEEYRGSDFGMALFPVPDVLSALQGLAKKRVQEANYKIVAITGSIGKTTTKEFAKTLLEGHYRLYASPLNYNTAITLPLNILMAEGDEEILLLEMGMTEPGNIANLVSIAPPDIALITTVSLQHANAFPKGLEAIAQEKADIFSHKKTEIALFHHDMPYASIARNQGGAIKKTFSLNSVEADYFLDKERGVVREGEIIYQMPLSFPLKAYYHNFLAALALARTLGLSPNQIKERIALLLAPPARFERVEKGGVVFINDAYNANPEAMIAAFEALPPPKVGGKKIAVLSEMNALGRFAEEEHLRVGSVALQYIDHLLCIGPSCLVMHSLWKNKPFEFFEDKEQLRVRIKALASSGDVVLLKGARAYALDEILVDF